MKQQTWKAGLVMVLVLVVAGSAVFAAAAPAPAKGTAPAKETAKAAPTHQELLWPDFWQTFHDPTPWLHMGLDQRLRIEAGENWQTLNNRKIGTDDRWMYERYRTRWSTKWSLNDDISFNTRLVWEFRTWQQPEDKAQRVSEPQGAQVNEWNADEALFDWFNVNIRNLGGLPLSATIGRQDIMFGVGWLVLDASPLDGSRTIGLFDAARFTYDWADVATKVDMIYANNSPESDRWLKPINDQDRGLMEQKEQAGILYLTNTSLKPIQLEGFFIYKQDRPVDNTLSNFPSVWAEKGEVYTFGAALAGTTGDHWKYRAEGAYQTGYKVGNLPSSLSATGPTKGPTKDLSAWGTLDTIEYQFKDPHDNATHFTYEYASGDDPGTAADERFDLLWGRWPRWSELMIYTWANETRVADTTNLHRFNVGHRIQINKQWQLTADYHALFADQNTGATSSNLSVSRDSDDKFRGHLVTSWLRYKFSDQLYGHFLAEYFFNAEEYYVAPSDENAYFLRVNVEYIF